MSRGAGRSIVVAAIALAWGAGCGSWLPGRGVDGTYGRIRGASVNGTGAFAAILESQGHEFRTTRRLNDESATADTIVRFAERPGPPSKQEAAWYERWLDGSTARRLVYVVRDFDARPEYWAGAIARLPSDADADQKKAMETLRDDGMTWPLALPPLPKEPADEGAWFGVEDAESATCATLGGPWAAGIDAKAAALPRRRALREDSGVDAQLLTCDGLTIVLSWHRFRGGAVLVAANGGFLVNAAMVNPARRPLAMRTAEWAGGAEPGASSTRRRILFVEGDDPFGGTEAPPSPWELARRRPFDLIVGQFLLGFGLVACLAWAGTRGRAEPEPPSGADRPAAHAEALGALLERTRDSAYARGLIDEYRRWRHPAGRGKRP